MGQQVRIIACVGIGLIMLLGILAFLGQQAVSAATKNAFHERMTSAQEMAADRDNELDHLAFHLSLAAESITMPTGDYAASAARLYGLMGEEPLSSFFRLSSLSIFDDQGRLLASTPSDQAVQPLDAVMQQTIAAGNFTNFAKYVSAATGPSQFASVVVPVSADWSAGKRVFIQVTTDIVPRIPSPSVPGGGSGYSVEIIRADGVTVESAIVRPGELNVHYALLKTTIASDQAGAALHIHPGYEHVVAAAPFAGGELWFILEQPADDAIIVPHQLENEVRALGTGAVIVALAGAWYITRTIVRPVRKLQYATKLIANGDLHSGIRVKAPDEVGELAADIESMRQQLEKNHNSLEQANAKLEQQVVERTNRLHDVLSHIITAQEEERARIARDLHDDQGQALTALALGLDKLGQILPNASPEVRNELQRASDMTRSLLQGTRRLIYDLRPSVLDDMGLEAAIRWSAETHLEHHGIQVTIQNSVPARNIPNVMVVQLFRIAQEAIVNVERHAQAKHVSIILEQKNSSLQMEIEDDGRGFNTDDIGTGLEGMRERARLIGGTIEIISSSGKGTTVILQVSLS